MEHPESDREAAVKRLKAKQDFKNHALIYVVVNALLVVIWALSGAGYFWPIWAIMGWGVGLAFNAWSAFFEKPITEAEIHRELERSE